MCFEPAIDRSVAGDVNRYFFRRRNILHSALSLKPSARLHGNMTSAIEAGICLLRDGNNSIMNNSIGRHVPPFWQHETSILLKWSSA